MKFWIKIRSKFRLLFGRCSACNIKKENHKDCYHCLSNKKVFCHKCAKGFNHASNYGMSQERLNSICYDLDSL